MTAQNSLRIKAIFAQAQHSITAHKKLSSELKTLHDELPDQFFFNAFTECLRVPLMCVEKMAPTERTIDFAVKFVTSFILNKVPRENEIANEESDEEDEMPKFVTDVFKFMCENASAENQTVRYRICQFINQLLNGLGNEACMDDDLCDLLCDRMLERLKDKSPLVRSQAVRALYRLQDPGDADCRVTAAYIFHFTSDPSPDVRGTALTNIAISSNSVPPILERSKDTNETVRKIAFTRLAEMNIQRFSIETRVCLLERGLKDSSEKVRKTATNDLLRSWFELYKGNFTSFLLALDCEHSTEISTLALETMFKEFKTGLTSAIDQIRVLQGSDKLIPVEELVAEKVLLWKVLIVYLEKHPEIAEERPVDEPLEELVPELSTFCTYVLKYFDRPLPNDDPYERIQREYILRQLLEMSETFDLSDEMGRSNLRSTCQTLLLHNGVSDRVIPALVKIIVKVIPNVDDRLQFLAEVIAELHDPADSEETPPASVIQMSAEEKRQLEIKEAKIKMKLNEMTEDQDEAVKAKDFIRAQQLQDECQKLRDELKALTAPPPQVEKPATQEVRSTEELVFKDRGKLQKCLCIVKEMMQHPSVVSLTPTLRSLMHNFVMPCLQQHADDQVVKNMALEAMGLFCLLDIDLAKEHFVYMFCFQIANDEVCEIALKITFDLLHLYGLEAFEIEEDKTDDSTKKRPKKKKNLFVTDTTEDEYEEDDDDAQSQTINSTNANTANLIGMLTSLLNSTSTNMRNLTMKGLCKLLLACRMTSSALLSRLMIMWYSPVTDGDEDFRQPLATFLEALSTICPRGQEMLEQAFLPTIRTIRDAPADSPISEVDLESVTKLFMTLTRPGRNKHHKKENTHVHNSFAVTLCNEILNQDDRYADDGVLLKALLQLELCLDDPVFRQDLQKFIGLMKEFFQERRERIMCKYVEKFEKMVQQSSPEEPAPCAEVDNTAQTEQLNNVDNTVRTDGLNSVNNTAQSSQLNGTAVSVVKKSRRNARILQRSEEDTNDTYDNSSENSVDFGSNRVADATVVAESPPASEKSFDGSDLDSQVEAERTQYSKRRRFSEDKSKKVVSSDQPISKPKPGTSKGTSVLAETVLPPRSPKKAVTQPAESCEDARSRSGAGAARETPASSRPSLRSDSSQEEETSSVGAPQRESRSSRRAVNGGTEPEKKKTAVESQRRESPRKSKDGRGIAEPVKRKAPAKPTNQKKDSPVKSVDSQEGADDDAEPAKRRAVDKSTNERKESPSKSVDSRVIAEDDDDSAKKRGADKRTNQRKKSPVKSVDSQESAEDDAEPTKSRAGNKRTNRRKESPVKSVESQESAEDDAEPTKSRAGDKRTNRRKESPVKSVNSQESAEDDAEPTKSRAFDKRVNRRKESPVKSLDSQESAEDNAEPAKRKAVEKRTNQKKESPVKSNDVQNKEKIAVNVVVVDMSAGRPIREVKLTPKLLAYKKDLNKRSPGANQSPDRRPAPKGPTSSPTPARRAGRSLPRTPLEKDVESDTDSSAESSAEPAVRTRATRLSEATKAVPAKSQKTASKANVPAKQRAGPAKKQKTTSRAKEGTSSDEKTSSPAPSVKSRRPLPAAGVKPLPVSQRQSPRNARNEAPKRATRSGSFSAVQSSSSQSSQGSGVTSKRASRTRVRPEEVAKSPTASKSPAQKVAKKIVSSSSSDEVNSPKSLPLRLKATSRLPRSSSDSPMPASSSSGSFNKPNVRVCPTAVVIPTNSSEESSEPEVSVRRARSGDEAKKAIDSSKDSPATTWRSPSNDLLQRAVERVRSGVMSQGASPSKDNSSSTGSSSEDIIQRAVERVRRSSVFFGESISSSSSSVYRILPSSLSSSASPAKTKSSGLGEEGKSKKTSKQGTEKESPTRSTERLDSKKTSVSSDKKTPARHSSSDSPPSKAGSESKSRNKAKSSVDRLSSSSFSSPSMSTRSQDFPNKLRARKRV